jgi:hypothetical protein
LNYRDHRRNEQNPDVVFDENGRGFEDGDRHLDFPHDAHDVNGRGSGDAEQDVGQNFELLDIFIRLFV